MKTKQIIVFSLFFHIGWSQTSVVLSGLNRLDVLSEVNTLGASASLLYSSSVSLVYIPSAISFLNENNVNINYFGNPELDFINVGLSFSHAINNRVSLGILLVTSIILDIPFIDGQDVFLRDLGYYNFKTGVSYKINDSMSIAMDGIVNIESIFQDVLVNGDIGFSYVYNVLPIYRIGVSYLNFISTFLDNVHLPSTFVLANTVSLLKGKLLVSAGLVGYLRNSEWVFSASVYWKPWKMLDVYLGFNGLTFGLGFAFRYQLLRLSYNYRTPDFLGISRIINSGTHNVSLGFFYNNSKLKKYDRKKIADSKVQNKDYAAAIAEWLNSKDEEVKNKEINAILDLVFKKYPAKSLDQLPETKKAYKESKKIYQLLSSDKKVKNWHNTISVKLNTMNAYMKQYFKEIEIRIKNLEYKEVIALYDKVIKLNPQDTKAKTELKSVRVEYNLKLALESMEKEKYKDAIEILEKTYKIDKNNNKVKDYLKRAKVLLESQRVN